MYLSDANIQVICLKAKIYFSNNYHFTSKIASREMNPCLLFLNIQPH